MVKCCDIKIGTLRHSIELQETTEVSDGAGGRSRKPYVTIATKKCSLKTKSGTTRLFAEAKDMPITHTLITRYFSDWQPANANKRRWKFGDREFKIIYVDNIDEENKFLEYTVQENVPT